VAKDANLYIRVKPDIKSQAEQIFSSFGITVSDAVNIFLHKAIMVGGLPFDVRSSIPNIETLEAMREVDEMKRNPSLGKSYTDVDVMIKELLA
jgi:DNA-damage-inducible protein J